MMRKCNLFTLQRAGDTNECAATGHRTLQNERGSRNYDLGTDADSVHDDDKLTPADLLTFAWQIAKGMVRDAKCLYFYCKYGFVDQGCSIKMARHRPS